MNIKNLEESLTEFITPELLEKQNQYFCEICDKKVIPNSFINYCFYFY